MIIGLLWYAWCNKRLDISESLISYALRHWGFVGTGDPTKTNMMPPLLATAAWISYKLGGPGRWWLRWIPCDFGGTPTDYEAHLQVLHILLRKAVTGGISWFDRATLNRQAKREPENPLFQFASGNEGIAETTLENVALWPQDQLPTSADRSEQWLPQRDYGPDWKPSTAQPVQTHSGGDFLWLHALMTGRLK